MGTSPAAKAQQDVERLKQLLAWARAKESQQLSREEESKWWNEIDSVVAYHLSPDHPDYLALKHAPDIETPGDPPRYYDLADDELARQDRENFKYSLRARKRFTPLSRCIALIEELIKTLPDKAMDVPERRKQREQFIRALYDLAEGRLDVPVHLGHIAERAGLHPTLARDITRDLGQSGHLMFLLDHHYALSVKGQMWAEELEAPMPKPPATVLNQQVTQNFHGSVGFVQTGNQNTAYVTQQINQNSAELVKILNTIQEASRQQPAEKRAEIDQHLTDIREEMAKPEADRKPSKLKAYCWALWAATRDTTVVAAAVAELLKFFGIGQ